MPPWWIETLLMRMYCEHEGQTKIENHRYRVMVTRIGYKIIFTESSWNKMTHGRQQIDIIFSQNEEHYSWFSRTLQMPLTYFKKYVNDKYMMLLRGQKALLA